MVRKSIARVRKSDGKILSVRSDDPLRAAQEQGIDGPPPRDSERELVPIFDSEDEEEIELEMDHAQVDAMFRGPDKAERDVFIERGKPVAKIPKQGGNTT